MGKNIVFCADGTWNHPDEKVDGKLADTNVRKLYDALPRSDSQVTFYDDGVGSSGTMLGKVWDGITGDGLLQKVKDGYGDIAQAYEDGDAIHIFGFSRGAYTARSLAGMLAFCGVPGEGRYSGQAVEDAFAAYRERDSTRKGQLLSAFKEKYGARPVTIAQIGVWDTVGALGIPSDLFHYIDSRLYGFLDTTLHPDIQAAWHAVSIDEKRSQFAPTLWQRSPQAPATQQLDQVWFAGVHSDVGGGYPDPCLSDITLGWMMKKAASKGLAIDQEKFRKFTSLDPRRAQDAVHSSWELIPYGPPKERTIPPGSAISNSVLMKIKGDPTYRPPNLIGGFTGMASGNAGMKEGMRVVEVLPPPPRAGLPSMEL